MEIPEHLRITRTVIQILPKTDNDRRYRALVTLVRADRPKIWTFHCPQCRRPLVELVNSEVIAITDLFDKNNIKDISKGLRCETRNCRIYWYFNLSV